MIPECTHPLSKHWDQPKNTEIEVDDSHALMSKKSFDELLEYSMSVPTALYVGKMWKANSGCWYLRWVEPDVENSNQLLIQSRKILIEGECNDGI